LQHRQRILKGEIMPGILLEWPQAGTISTIPRLINMFIRCIA
jgi:hypothetical protein